MYIRTPKRYARRGRRHNLISCRRVLFYLLVLVFIFVGIGIYENAEMWQDDINNAVDQLVGQAGETIATVNAPPPTPTLDPSADLQRANDAWINGSIQEAVNLYRRAASATPNDLVVHYRLAFGLIQEGKFEEALAAAERAITASPLSPDGWAIKSMALNRLDRNTEAIAAGMQALELVTLTDVDQDPQMAPSRARAQAFLAEAYLNEGQGERAFTLAEQAIETYPDSFEAYQIRGKILQDVFGDVDNALEDYQTAYDLAPNMIYLGIWLARLERALQNYDVALQLYQDFAERNPANSQLLYELGEYYFRVDGNYPESTSYFNRCVESDPDSTTCWYMLGRSQISSEEIIAAQDSFLNALELDDTGLGGYIHYWAAESYIRLGQCPQAIPYLQQGNRIARENVDSGLIEAFEFSFQECGLSASGGQATPEPIPDDAEGESA